MTKFLDLPGIILFAFFSAHAAYGSPSKGRPVTNKVIILATTTSTQDSGLLDVLVPLFQEKTGYIVKTIAVGTGHALAMGRRGDADVLLVHAPAEEEGFVAGGHGLWRRPFMYNDFVLAGPAADPASISKAATAVEALRRIATSRSLFISRGDHSGTHLLEKKLWVKVGLQPNSYWYQQSGQGMGQTLIIASEKDAYILVDRGTYVTLKPNLRLTILYEGDPQLINTYSIIRVNPRKSSEINGAGAKAFLDFMLLSDTLRMIGKFGLEKYGVPLFRPLGR